MKPETPKLSKAQQRKAAEEARIQVQESRGRIVKLILIGWCSCLVFLPLGIWAGYLSMSSERAKIREAEKTVVITPEPKPNHFTPDLGHLVMLSAGQLEGTDIAAMDLACAVGLPGDEKLNVPDALHTLDVWAEHVRVETARNLHRFKEHPEQNFNSESWYRAAIVITVLQQDFGVHYNLERMRDLSFTHAEDVLMYGLVSDLREGTCSSMPVLYVAIGRRLGYPLHLVRAKGHYFARWESKDGKVRFNMEATGEGLGCHSDDFYKGWPYQISKEEMDSGMYLRNMTSAEEMAEFLMQRADVLDALHTRMPEAEQAFAEAHALVPNNPASTTWLMLAGGKEDMMLRGLLDPKDPKNPFKDKLPPPYEKPPPSGTAEQQFVKDESAK